MAPLSPERWQEIERWVEKAVAADLDERSVLLADLQKRDAELHREVVSLLDNYRDDSFLERPVLQDLVAEEGEPPDGPLLEAGTQVGAYEVVRELGAGGMGHVYLAARADQEFEASVAIKVLRPELSLLRQRFLNERQILAALDHPNIARLSDGGTLPDGRAYLIMDYIDGLPIVEHCRQQRLGLRQRLELVATVCSAVDSAHRNLVVHRDIKPSNLLVTGDGEPKLIDFGIAKLLSPMAGQPTAATTTGLHLMTPSYASPEQLLGRPLTTATDVYSLGVVLYEMLTGRLPFGDRHGSVPDLLSALASDEPMPAGTRAVDVEAVGVAEKPRAWRRQLSGEIENILSKCLQREPEQRYASAKELADDIRRYLDGFPVRAQGESTFYRFSKLVRRNRISAIAIAALVLLVSGFFVTTLRQNVRIAAQAEELAKERNLARSERDAVERVVDFLLELFQPADPTVDGANLTSRELLDQGAQRIDEELTDQPLVRARVMASIGQIYNELRLPVPAEPLVTEALEIRQQMLGDQHELTAQSFLALGRLRTLQSSQQEAIAAFRRANEIFDSLEGDPDPETKAMALNELGLTLFYAGHDSEAAEALQQALTFWQPKTDPHDIGICAMQQNLAMVRASQGDYGEAERLYRSALEVGESVDEPTAKFMLMSILDNLGLLMQRMGRFAEAESYSLRAVDTTRQFFTEEDGILGIRYYNLALAYQLQRRFEDAEEWLQRALKIWAKNAQPINTDFGFAYYAFGELYRDWGRLNEAEDYLQRALEIYRQAGSWRTVYCLASLGLLQVEMGKLETARRTLTAAIETEESNSESIVARPNFQRRLAMAWFGRGRIATLEGRPADAEQAWDRTLEILAAHPKQIDDFDFAHLRALIYLHRGDLKSARAPIEQLRATGWQHRSFARFCQPLAASSSAPGCQVAQDLIPSHENPS